MAMAAADLASQLQAHATAGLVVPACVALAASAHPAWVGADEDAETCPLGGFLADRSIPAKSLTAVGSDGGTDSADWLLGGVDSDANSDSDAAYDSEEGGLGLETGDTATTSRGAERRARVTARAMRRHAASLVAADGQTKSLRPAASRWLRRAVRRGRLSAMPASAIAWALVAGAPAGEAGLALSEDEFIQALLLGCESSSSSSSSSSLPLGAGGVGSRHGVHVPKQAGPGEVALAAEAAVLLGGAPLLLRAREEVPWLDPLLAARQGSVELLRCPMGSGSVRQQPTARYVSSVLGSGTWQEGLPGRLSMLSDALLNQGWGMRVGERLGESLMTDLTLVKLGAGDAGRHERDPAACAQEGSLVAVVCESPRVFWRDAAFGLLPGERSRREALRELCGGTPLVRTDVAKLAGAGTEAGLSMDEAAASLAKAAANALQQRRAFDQQQNSRR
jgi:hypothetical protein